jgi:hypothetical protein
MSEQELYRRTKNGIDFTIQQATPTSEPYICIEAVDENETLRLSTIWAATEYPAYARNFHLEIVYGDDYAEVYGFVSEKQCLKYIDDFIGKVKLDD